MALNNEEYGGGERRGRSEVVGQTKASKSNSGGLAEPAPHSLGFALAFIFAVRHCCSCCLSAYCCGTHLHPQTVACTLKKEISLPKKVNIIIKFTKTATYFDISKFGYNKN